MKLFNYTWLSLSIVLSLLFSFWLYPDIYNKITGSTVRLYFTIKTDDGKVTYVTNKNGARANFDKFIYDNARFYYTACDLISFPQRESCDEYNNWLPIDSKIFGCSDVRNCFDKEYVIISKLDREKALLSVNTQKGNTLLQKGHEGVSLSDPAGWGADASLPLFFIFIFFGLKLGNLIKPYLFLSEKQNDKD